METVTETATATETATVTGTEDGSDAETATDEQPSVNLANASLPATVVDRGETVTATVTVVNDGRVAANRTLRLRADGETVRTKTVGVTADAGQTVTLNHTFDEPGEYDLALGNESLGSVTVERDDDATAETTETPDAPDDGTETAETTPAGPGTTSTADATTTDGSAPGFGVVVALGALLAVALAARRL